MAHEAAFENPLLSTKPTDSNITISLHPLVLLTVSDHITRHRVRGQDGPIVGALLGQQKGREITVEHAFQCKAITNTTGQVILDQSWFEERLQQYRDVHKIPALDFVGWFTLCPETGPTPALVAIHKQAMLNFNESALLLAFHPSAMSPTNASTSNGKLPLTVYESAIESDQNKGDGAMQIDGEELPEIKFRSLPYTIETDETEMIAIDYVAKGAGSAVAVHVEGEKVTPAEEKEKPDRKGKQRADELQGQKLTSGPSEATLLSTEEEDQIAGITTRLNSVHMLESRLSLLSTFIRSQLPSYLSDPERPLNKTSPDPTQLLHLRNIQALLTRLSLLTPSSASSTSLETDPLNSAALSQSNDVALTSLLSVLGQDVQGLSELGRKFASVEHAKSQKGKGKGPLGGNTFGGAGDSFDVSMGGSSMMV